MLLLVICLCFMVTKLLFFLLSFFCLFVFFFAFMTSCLNILKLKQSGSLEL